MQPAERDPQTRTALSAYQAGALCWLGGGLIAVVLGALLGAVVASPDRSGNDPSPAGLVVVALILGGTAAAAAGLGGLVRHWRWRRALAGTPWRRGLLRCAGPALMAFEPEGYDELGPGDERVRLRLLSTAIWRTRAVQRMDGAEVRAAPVGRTEWVLTADGVPTLYGARAVRRRR
ncbi:MAG TPA: hypothetical protein VHF92_07435 [Geodermatophilus sp.]|nr:hypothetical protein [Geodermatophilus sp.]